MRGLPLAYLLANGWAIGVATAVAGGLLIAFGSATWGSYTIARCWLAWRRNLPWRLMAFLEDAHQNREVLRQVGAVYQFRHSDLRRYLADKAADHD